MERMLLRLHKAKIVKIEALYIVAAALMPSILLFNLYNGNYMDNHIVFLHVIVLASALAVSGILLFLFFWLLVHAISHELLIFRNYRNWCTRMRHLLLGKMRGEHQSARKRSKTKEVPQSTRGEGEVSLIVVTIFWALFWNFRSFESFFGVSFAFMAVVLGSSIFLTLALLLRLRLLLAEFKFVFGTLSLILLAMFIVNASPAFHRNLTRVQVAGESEIHPSLLVKREFLVDSALPRPDIYWVHLDGMVSLNTVERFFELEKDWVRQGLAERGFLIFEDSYLRKASNTAHGMVQVLSPMFYDEFFGTLVGSIEGGPLGDTSAIRHHLDYYGVSLEEHVIPYFELFAALLHAGYTIQRVNEYWWNILDVPRIMGASQGGSAIALHFGRFWMTDLPYMLSLVAPFPHRMPEHREFRHDAPFFRWFAYYDTHAIYWTAPFGLDEDRSRFDLYPHAYDIIVRNMFNRVDRILRDNPDAVIVLQADHGIHQPDAQRALLDAGVSMEEVWELAYSVFSAVRIPEMYGSLDEPIHPLNVSRVLVNRFVGENYALLPQFQNNR